MFKFNPEGYNLIEVSKDEWYLQVVGKVAFKGTLKEVGIYSVTYLGFSLIEFTLAIQNMIHSDCNSAHFGINRRFIYTFNNNFLTEKKAG